LRGEEAVGKGKRRGRFEVEWITISYRTLLRWLGALAALGLFAALIWLGFRLEATGEARDVERLVGAVERDLRAARAGHAAAQAAVELNGAEGKLRDARVRLGRRDLPGARAAAEEARETLRRLGGQPADKARMLRVEGKVRVKPVGSLEWTDAKTGMSLNSGDLVQTDGSSAAQILNLDGSTVTLRSDTVLRIERSAKDRVSGKTDVAVEVNSGQLTMATAESQLPGSINEVRTVNARASVDPNTVLGVGVEPGRDRSQIDVITGRARVQSGSSLIEVGSSERLSVSPEGLERRRLPGTPDLTSPPQYKLLLSRDLEKRPAELEWGNVRDARSYRVELGQTPLFTQVRQRWDSHPTNYVVVDKLPVGRYYWRVTAVDRDGVEGGPSPAWVFQVSDVVPEGEPPPLKVTSVQPLGEGMFLFEGKTQPGVFLTIDDGFSVVTLQPVQSGEFRRVIKIAGEGLQVVTITARSSEGLERKVREPVEVRYQ
jgi:hypothetical protein